MSQTYFSVTPLDAGSTSASFTLPTADSDGGSRLFVAVVSRDPNALAADGSPDANQAAVVTVEQDGNTLLTLSDATITASAMFQPNPAGGTVSITNNGPGAVNSVAIEDGFRR